MNYEIGNNVIILKDIDSFDIAQILECGQCFRFKKIEDYKYRIVANQKVLYIGQTEQEIRFYPCNEEDFKNIWIDYFDLNKDYNKIKEELSKDKILKQAIEYAPGIRILNQDTWECLISFIISQNNRIPMIKQAVENISKKYGTLIEDECYSFPTLDQLQLATEEDLKECKTGFRAKYILNACQMTQDNSIKINDFKNMTTEEVRQNLMTIKGVGPKIADCVLLFSQNRGEVFPTDVWIKRIMQYFYFEGETNIKEIHKFAYEKFGSLAGIAQQYLFNYARNKNINPSV